jgi:adenylate kinase
MRASSSNAVTQRMILVVLGKQGAGKGTQCVRLAESYRIPHVSTGDILRAAVKAGSELGREVTAVMDAGQLVNDDLIMRVVADRLSQSDAVNGALLDGCTRTLAQAESLDALLGEPGVALVINIDVETELVTERLSARRVCQECATTYTDSDISAISGTCENCGGDVVQRPDDTPTAIRTRLEAYERDTAPLLDYYGARGLLVTINGDQAVERVTADIEAAITQRGLR